MPARRLAVGMRSIVATMMLGFSVCATGQDVPLQGAATLGPATGQPTPPGGVPLGPMIVYPGLDFSVGHNDNLFSSNINKRGSTQTVVSPSVKIEAKTGPHKFDAYFRMDDLRYSNSPSDNYTAYSLLGNADLVISGRAGLKVRAEYRRAADPRGSTDRAGSATPDEYINQGIGGIFAYGAPGAQGRIEIDAGAFSRRYQNNRATTEVSDRDYNQIGATFFWRVAPKTEILALAQRRGIDYTLPTSTQDSTETSYLVGAKWEATAKTTGIVKFGRLEKKFDTGARTNFSGSSWDATVRWSPLTYSVLDFNTSKATNESTGTGDFLITQSYGVVWNHAWNSRFSSAANASWRNDQFQGGGSTREDKTGILGLRLNYQWQRWLRFSGEYTRTDRTSSINTLDFGRNLILFTVGATL
jgi:hypothetical protein